MAKNDKPSNAIGCLAALVIAIIVVIVVVIVNLFNGDDDKKEEKDDKVTVSKDASAKEKLAANIKNNIGKEHIKSITLKENEENEDDIFNNAKDYAEEYNLNENIK